MRDPTRLKRLGAHLWREWIRPALLAAGVVLPLKSAVADWNWVPSGSMKPTILEGDLVLVNKLAYDLRVPFTLWRAAEWKDPERDDIIVCFSPRDGVRLVKRVVAVPGDTIELRNNVLFRNGQPLDYRVVPAHPFKEEIYEDPNAVVARESSGGHEHWVMALPSRAALRNFPLTTLPTGRYFVMGDSRDNALTRATSGSWIGNKLSGESGALRFRSTRIITTFRVGTGFCRLCNAAANSPRAVVSFGCRCRSTARCDAHGSQRGGPTS